MPRQHCDELGEHPVGAVQPARCVVDPRVVVEPGAGDVAEGGVDGRLFEGEQALLPDQVGVGELVHRLIIANRTHVRKRNLLPSVTPRTISFVVIEIDDPLDPRLVDYRGLRERRKESDEYFIVEGLTAIERLLTSPYPVRSLLLTPATLARLARPLDGVTTYVISVEAMSSVAGVNLHRGAVASADTIAVPVTRRGAPGCTADR